MEIKYSVINNKCYDDADGIITINSINFDNQDEANKFIPYDIVWSGQPKNTILSKDKRILYNLSDGTYSFKLKNILSGIESEEYIVSVSSPEPLQIQNIEYSPYSCGSNGFIKFDIIGGIPPYQCYNGLSSFSTSLNEINFSNLADGFYNISVQDSNGCSIKHDETIKIVKDYFIFNIDKILTPNIRDSFVPLSFHVIGSNNEFILRFYNIDTKNSIEFASNDHRYLVNSVNNKHSFYLPEQLYPGQYKIEIISNNGCVSSSNFSLPNTLPININCNITPTVSKNNIIYNTSLPIFDTLLIPYNLIINNSNILQAIKEYKLKQIISFNIDDNLYKFTITRNILNKYLLDSHNKLEMLVLGEESKDWYFYLQLAPGINIENNPEFLKSQILLNLDNIKLPVCLGVSSDGNLSSDQISLVRGSLIMSGILNNQFDDTKTYYITLDKEINELDNYQYTIKNTKIHTHKNMYNVGYVTIINFLSDFDILNQEISIENTNNKINIDYNNRIYASNIKNLLIAMNTIENNILIYFIKDEYIGSINLFINGQPYFITSSGIIDNEYTIEYYYFDHTSIKPNTLFKNNEKIINDISIRKLPEGFIIVKIKDIYNNKPNYITYNNLYHISYDEHFLSISNVIKNYNSNILEYIEYGDIICYIPSENNTDFINKLNNIPTFIKPHITTKLQNVTLFNRRSDDKTKVLQQTKNPTNTSLNIKIYPKHTKCILKGSNQYELILDDDIKIINMIPGVYNIYGEEQDLIAKNLYQTLNRIILDKNNNLDIDIKFNSYNDKIFIKESE